MTLNSRSQNLGEFSEEIAELVFSENGLESFSQLHLEFLTLLSKQILGNPQSREFPDLMTFGYFIRPSNIKRYLLEHNESNNHLKVGVGVAVHVAPSNIPINFAFSWLYGFISGCRNLVRLPTRDSTQANLFIQEFERASYLRGFDVFRRTNYFFRSQRGDSRFNTIVGRADAVLVWGGDESIEYFRTLIANPACRQLYFPSRQSSLVLSSKAVGSLTGSIRNDFLKKLYNDTYLTDCNACSSPSKIFFVGTPQENHAASKMFFSLLDDFVSKQDRPAPIVQRMLDSLSSSGELRPKTGVHPLNRTFVVFEAKEGLSETRRPLRFGAFMEHSIASLREVITKLSRSEQTILHWGFEDEEVEEFSRALSPIQTSATRLVKLGSALDMGFYWEGRDNPAFLVKYFHLSI